jgi:hypothetical protein
MKMQMVVEYLRFCSAHSYCFTRKVVIVLKQGPIHEEYGIEKVHVCA